MRALRHQVDALTTERDRLKERIEVVLGEYSLMQTENRSLRESCRVLELENVDLMASEKSLKEILGSRTCAEQTSSPRAGGIDLVKEDQRIVESEVRVMCDTAKEALASGNDDSDDEREAHRYRLRLSS